MRSILFILYCFICTHIANGKQWYINKNTGNDNNNGLSPIQLSATVGPKKNINKTLALINTNDTINISSGIYNDTIYITKNTVINCDSVSIKRLEINANNNKLLLTGNYLQILDSLVLINGIIEIQNNFQLRLLTSAEVSGGNRKSFVKKNLYRALANGNGRILFPLGIENNYRPFYLNYNQNIIDTQFHQITYFQNIPPEINKKPSDIKNISPTRYFSMQRKIQNKNTSYIFECGYDTSGISDQAFDRNNLKPVFNKLTGKGWVNLQGIGTFDTTGFCRSGNGVDTVGLITIANVYGGKNYLQSQLPFANYSVNGFCEKDTTFFINKTFVNTPSKITKYFWDFGDASSAIDTSTILNPNFVYKFGTYNPKLIVITDSNYTDTIVFQINIHRLPQVKIASLNICFGKKILCADSSVFFNGIPRKNNEWKYKTLSQKNKLNYAIPDSNAGVYSIKLIVENDEGCIDSAQKNIGIFSNPKANFITKNVCAKDTAAYLRIKNIDSLEKISTYNWYINNIFNKKDSSTKIRYNNNSANNVKLVAINKYGCRDSIIKRDTSFSTASGIFYLAKKQGNDSVQCKTTNNFIFTDKITIGKWQSAIPQWKFGNTYKNILDSSYQFADTGKYTVKLIINTSRGCADSFAKTYFVRGFVIPNFAIKNNCAPDSILFQDSATKSTSLVNTYNWKINGNNLSQKNAKFLFTTAGNYTAKLIVTNSEKCTDSISKNFSLVAYPKIVLAVNGSMPFCSNDSVQIKASGANSFKWLNDNDTNRNKFFKSAGNFIVIAKNNNCISKDSILIKVYKTAKVKAFSDTAIYVGDSVYLSATGALNYTWKPGTFLNKTAGNMVLCKPLNSIRYTVKGTDINGCVAEDSVWISVAKKVIITTSNELPNFITPNGDGNNDFWDISALINYKDYEVSITNQKGKLIFYTKNNYLNNFNASENGKNFVDGVYYYQLKSNYKIICGYIQVYK